jgi:hypothetical protein
MKINEIKEFLEEENPEALFADGFDEALIGISRRCGQPSLAVYSISKCLEILEREMTPLDAEGYFEFNVVGAWLGPNTPIFLEDRTEEMSF